MLDIRRKRVFKIQILCFIPSQLSWKAAEFVLRKKKEKTPRLSIILRLNFVSPPPGERYFRKQRKTAYFFAKRVKTFVLPSVSERHDFRKECYISSLSANYLVTTITIVSNVTFSEQRVGIRRFHREFDEFPACRVGPPSRRNFNRFRLERLVPRSFVCSGRCVQRAAGTRWKRVRHARFRFVLR